MVQPMVVCDSFGHGNSVFSFCLFCHGRFVCSGNPGRGLLPNPRPGWMLLFYVPIVNVLLCQFSKEERRFNSPIHFTDG